MNSAVNGTKNRGLAWSIHAKGKIGLALIAASALAACGPGENDVAVVHEDGSQLSVEAAIDSELRAASMALETFYTTDGKYSADVLTDPARYEAVHNVDLEPVRIDAESYCLEGHGADVVRHVASGNLTPQGGPCPS